MKPIETHIRLLQVLLIVAATSLTLIGFLFSGQDMSAVLGTIDLFNPPIPVIITLSHVFYFTGFLCTYLAFEFYGFKTAIFTVLAQSLMMAGGYYLFLLLNNLADTYRIPFYDKRVLGFFTFPYPDFVAGLIAFFVGLNLTFLIAAAIKKITQNYFMFIRYPIGALIGFAAYVGLETYFRNAGIVPAEATDQLLTLALPYAAEFALFIFASVIPLYLLRLFLGLFRGRHKVIPVAPATAVTAPVAHAPLVVDAPASAPVVQALAESAPDGPSRPAGPSLWKTLLIVPTLLGTVAAIAFFGLVMAYHYNLILDVPYFVVEAHNAPLRSAALVGLGVTAGLMAVRLLVHGLGKVLSRKKTLLEKANASAATSAEDEVTVSEKVDPSDSPAHKPV